MNDLSALSDSELIEYYRLFKHASKRAESYKVNLFDVKYLYHLVRLIDEIDQILTYQDLDLQRNREELKAIRRGDLTLAQVENLAEIRQKDLEKKFANSKLQEKPSHEKLKSLLMNCIEQHYGSIENAVSMENEYYNMIQEIRKIIR